MTSSIGGSSRAAAGRLLGALQNELRRDGAALTQLATTAAARGGIASTTHVANASSYAHTLVEAAHSRQMHSRGFAADAKAGKTGETITVTFVDRDGERFVVKAPVGENLLEVAHENNVDLEGACEGSLACSTCHVIVEDRNMYDKIPEPTDDENDMLDLAFGLTNTSRLGCQVIATKDLDGLVVKLPAATRNMAVDGFKPKPH